MRGGDGRGLVELVRSLPYVVSVVDDSPFSYVGMEDPDNDLAVFMWHMEFLKLPQLPQKVKFGKRMGAGEGREIRCLEEEEEG